MRKVLLVFLLAFAFLAGPARAGGGPFGIDSRVTLDESGIWKRSNQKLLYDVTIVGIAGAALVEGSESRFGRTLWQSVDSMLVGQLGYAVLDRTFRRLRPSQTSDPDQWFKHRGNSFPSGEVTLISAAVAPMVFEYGKDRPLVYALELLPLYDAIARVKSRAHWQSDVLAGWAVGTAAGYYAHSRDKSFTVMVLPHGLTVGWHKQF